MNAVRTSESADERMAARSSARACYKEAVAFAVTTLTDKKAKVRDRLLAAGCIIMAAAWDDDPTL